MEADAQNEESGGKIHGTLVASNCNGAWSRSKRDIQHPAQKRTTPTRSTIGVENSALGCA